MMQKPRKIRDTNAGESQECVDCGRCVKECAFLARYGTPGQVLKNREAGSQLAFGCSLCGLCTSVCPVDFDPAGMFLEMRRQAVKKAGEVLPEHKVLLAYERRGMSRRYTFYSLPEGCDSVFFPGCTLPGTRPETTIAAFEALKKMKPATGIVLDCCGKPSHDLGRTEFFSAMFDEMANFLSGAGVRRIITACPNCHAMFSKQGGAFRVQTVYEVLGASGRPASGKGCQSATVTVHDPCVLRFEAGVQNAARDLLAQKGLQIEEMAHSRINTVCCGEGGAAGFVLPAHAENWARIREAEAAGRTVVTYCAGCAGKLKKYVPTLHLLDVFFFKETALAGKARVYRPPLTYWNRIKLKKTLKKKYPAAIARERTFTADSPKIRPAAFKKWLLILAFVALVAGVQISGAARFLEAGALEDWVHGFGPWAPAIYILFYAAAPALFLPGLPITIAGGLLFGPFWGVVYAITGATAGACAAFIIARYAARDWVVSKLSGPRWKRLHAGVESQGWKIVAITRLIPLFPFNLLNYAFGVTRVRFLTYAVTSFICMLPACIAYIVFASSLPDLLAGNLSTGLIAGVVLIALVSAIPLAYRRFRAGRRREEVDELAE